MEHLPSEIDESPLPILFSGMDLARMGWEKQRVSKSFRFVRELWVQITSEVPTGLHLPYRNPGLEWLPQGIPGVQGENQELTQHNS